MSTQLVRLAAAVLSSEKGRKTVGWVLAAILSPVILLTAFLCCVGSGTAEHNSAVVSAAFYGTELSTSVPAEYRAQFTQIRDHSPIWMRQWPKSIKKPRETALTRYRSRPFSLPLCFGADALSQSDARGICSLLL